MLKYNAMVFIARYCGEIVELNTISQDILDCNIDKVEFIPIQSGGFMDQEIEDGRYAETYFAVDMGGNWVNPYNAILITSVYNATINCVGSKIGDNIVKILSYLVAKKTIKMISFTEFDNYLLNIVI
jgi:hypothetical protein